MLIPTADGMAYAFFFLKKVILVSPHPFIETEPQCHPFSRGICGDDILICQRSDFPTL